MQYYTHSSASTIPDCDPLSNCASVKVDLSLLDTGTFIKVSHHVIVLSGLLYLQYLPCMGSRDVCFAIGPRRESVIPNESKVYSLSPRQWIIGIFGFENDLNKQSAKRLRGDSRGLFVRCPIERSHSPHGHRLPR
jgi:hypothetical protein